ncbi:MAG TPA: outer membrane protein assembly factor BamD [Polyangiaceae bacterium]|jgi:hypothetical protein|nr:outer membrane protein assembly factor BamD [Polyangiaceae bacterium]
MKGPSEQARRALERYRAATSPATADKTRLLDVIQQRALRGDLPRFAIQSALPVIPKASIVQSLWASTLGKVGVALVVAGVPALGIYEGRKLTHHPSTAPVVVSPSAAHEPEDAPTPPQSLEQTLSLAPAEASALPRGRSEKGTSSSEPTIDEEIKLMTRAQTSLRAGDPKQALQLLNEAARRFPNSKLATARAVSHMTALCAAGRSDEARAEASRFLAKNPGSPFTDRVKDVCLASPKLP